MRHLLIYSYIDEIAKVGSIRKAAETLSITPSALNRRILTIEEELGVPLFERLPRGVRLSTAGELFIHQIRRQMSEMEQLKSQIADLSGVRRGHTSIACSQALLPYFIPEQIEIYQSEHPGVTFSVISRDREAAEESLSDYTSDIALVFEPVRVDDFETLLTIVQPIHAVLAKGHPLAKRRKLRLFDCMNYPLALPIAPYGVRVLLNKASKRLGIDLIPYVQSDSFDFLRNFARTQNTISFQIQIGLPQARSFDDMVHIPVDKRDIPPGLLHLTQLKGRTLPVASARFVDQLINAFVKNFECA